MVQTHQMIYRIKLFGVEIFRHNKKFFLLWFLVILLLILLFIYLKSVRFEEF